VERFTRIGSVLRLCRWYHISDFGIVLCYGSHWHFDRSQWCHDQSIPAEDVLCTGLSIISRHVLLPHCHSSRPDRSPEREIKALIIFHSHFRHSRRGDTSIEHALCPPWYLCENEHASLCSPFLSVRWRRPHSRARLVSLFKESELVRHISLKSFWARQYFYWCHHCRTFDQVRYPSYQSQARGWGALQLVRYSPSRFSSTPERVSILCSPCHCSWLPSRAFSTSMDEMVFTSTGPHVISGTIARCYDFLNASIS